MVRKISFLLTFLMLCTISFAQTIGQQGDEIKDINNTYDKLQFFIISPKEGNYTCCVRARSGATGEVVVPKEIEVETHHKFQVVRAERFGSNASGITKITFPEGLQEIGDGCFQRSTALIEFNIPSTVTKIGKDVFFECTSLTNIDVASGNNNFKLETYNDQKMLLSKDGADLYYYLATNKSDNTNNGYCTLPNTITHIHPGAITSNPNFTYLKIPKSVTKIDPQAIYYNGKHSTFTVEDGNANFGADGGVLTNKDGHLILCVPYNMGKDVQDDNNRTKRVFEINGTTGYTQINPNAFYYCDKLNEIIIPEGIQVICDSAFSNCSNLKEITFPASLTTIVKNPFFRLSQMTAYHVKAGNTHFFDIDGVLFDYDKKKLIKFPLHKNYINGTTSYTIPTSVEEIGEYAFNEAAFTSINIPNTVKKIDEAAFKACTKLETVTFDPTSQVTEIGQDAFQRCDALSNITIPESVTKIDQGAFYNSGLQTVDIEGASLESIGNQAFCNCHKLTQFNISEDSKITSFGWGAFQNDENLTSFTLPKDVTTLGQSVFSGCKGMTDFKFAGNNVATLSGYLFSNCEKLTNITLPESLKTIQVQAFAGCKSLGNLTIPAATTSVDHDSFRFCDNLKNIYVADGNTQYSSVDGMLCTGGDKHNEVLYTMPPGRANSDYTLLPTIKTIGTEACFWNQNLTNIAIPSSVTTIQKDAFYGCRNLNTVTCMGGTAPTLEADALNYALTNDATLYYRKRDEANYQTWGVTGGVDKFKHRFPSFNYGYRDDKAGRPENANDLVEYIPLSDNAAAVVSNESVDPETEGGKTFKQSTKTTLIIPENVSHTYTKDSESKTFTYTTKVVYDNAFTTNDQLRTLTFFGPITYIGVNAFHKRVATSSSTTDETTTEQPAFSDGIYFVHDFPEGEGVLFAQDKYNLDNSYNAFANGQKVYVKVSQKEAYEKALKQDKHPCVVETNIPLTFTKSKNAYGDYLATFCREFDAYFPPSEKVVPYKTDASSYRTVEDKEGYNAIIKATSIDDGKVPAWTGVILRNKKDNAETNNDSYYQIAEKQDAASNGESLMKGLYEDTQLTQETGNNTNFCMKNSIFYPINAAGGTALAFHAYLSLNVPENAKITMLFNNGTTGIDGITTDRITDTPVYNINGMKVADSWKQAYNSLPAGLYIVNGKKVLKK